jgi:hypothetical protein
MSVGFPVFSEAVQRGKEVRDGVIFYFGFTERRGHLLGASIGRFSWLFDATSGILAVP